MVFFFVQCMSSLMFLFGLHLEVFSRIFLILFTKKPNVVNNNTTVKLKISNIVDFDSFLMFPHNLFATK